MNVVSEIVSGILRGLVKAAVLVLSTVVVLAVLCVGLVVVLATLLRSVLTGRRPAVFTTFTRFNQTAGQFQPGSWPGSTRGGRPDTGDVVDVQAHEVRSALNNPLPPKAVD
jgi:hypothetical protein